MAYRRRNYRRSYNRRSYRKSFYRRGGHYRAAQQMTDSSRVVLKYNFQKTLTIPTTAANAVEAVNLWQLLAESGFYDNYAKMFDQVRLNGAKLVIGQQYVSSSNIGNVTLITAIDRNGISYSTTGVPTFDTVCSYGSAKQKMLVPGGTTTAYVSTYASNMAEKSQFVPTAVVPNFGVNRYDDENNQTILEIFGRLAYKPIFIWAVGLAAAPAAATNIVFSVQCSFDVTFRGTRADFDAIE